MAMQAEMARTDTINYRLLRIASERFGTNPDGMSPQQTREATDIARREMFMEGAILQQPEARKVMVPQAELDSAVQMIRKRYVSDEEFEDALAANGLDEQTLRFAVERELRVEAVLNYISRTVDTVDETEARLFYYLHPEKFAKEETRVVRHILITINQEFAENTEANARARIETIRGRLKKHPHRFEQQALQHSECPSALQGGLIGEVKQGTLYPELDAVLFRMDAGQLSEVIQTDNGFHILLCEAIKPASKAPLSDVLPALQEQLTQRQRVREQKRWLKQVLSTPANTTAE
ncbi:nitrogen fixation protein NifM [Ketobacter sp.]|uniref:nitrogen fixation protein NifM n=1 Tax=Ketobacter sp. TaxID=2083498 RepID=UPI0025C082CA|nr:nitrogen fixation protein NifM [Ketobacter sp.]